VTTVEERSAVAAVPPGGVTAQTLAPPSGVAQEPVRTASTAPAAAPTARVATPAPVERGLVSQEPVRPSVLFVQAGAFIDVTKARVLRQQLATIGDSRIVPVFLDGVQFYRVRIGPLQNVANADRTLERVIAAGHTEARIVVVD
jgi:rare lipoprotein A